MVRMPRGGRNWEHLTEIREKSKSWWVGEAPSPTRPPARPPLHFTPLSSTLPLIPPLFVVCVGGVHGPTHPELLHVSATAFKVWRKPAWGDGPPATEAVHSSRRSPWCRVNLNLTFGRTVPWSHTLVENHQSMPYRTNIEVLVCCWLCFFLLLLLLLVQGLRSRGGSYSNEIQRGDHIWLQI